MLEKALIEIVRQGRIDNISVQNVDKLVSFNHFMDSLTRRLVGITSNITPMAAFVKKQVKIMVERVWF